MLRHSLTALFAIALTSAACGDSTGSSDTSAQGSYALVRANGQPLPSVIQSGATGSIEITRGALELRADGSFSHKRVYRFARPGSISVDSTTETGAYVQTNSAVQLSIVEVGRRDTYNGTLTGRDLSFTAGSVSYVYRR